MFIYAFIIAALLIFLSFTFGRSRHGRAVISIREDEIASESMGINTTYYKLFAFVLAAFFAGVAGGLAAHQTGMIDPSKYDFNRSVEILIMVVLGGMGSITGSVISASVLTLLPEMLRDFNQYRMLVYSVILILVMLFKPTGLLGRYEISIPGLARKCPARCPEPPVRKSAERGGLTMTVLETKDLGITFGGLKALDDVYIRIDEKEIVGLIGPNGAGKTTVFNLLTGVYTPTKGAIRFEGQSIIGKKPYQINRLGIARTFQNIRLFKNMTVLDNIKVAMNQNMSYSVVSGMFRLPSYWKQEKAVGGKARELLRLFDMEDVGEQQAGNLPYGQQRKLEILRALASEPKLLLLDEPAAGMNPTETKELMEVIRGIRDRFGVAILLIEHDMSLVMEVCERLYVLDYGTLIATGTPDEVRKDERVIKAYLGG